METPPPEGGRKRGGAAPFTMRRMFIIAGVLVVGLPIVAYLVIKVHAARAWAEVESRLAAAGMPRSWEEMDNPALVPDEENFFGTSALQGIVMPDSARGAENRQRLEALSVADFWPSHAIGVERPRWDPVAGRRDEPMDLLPWVTFARASGALKVDGHLPAARGLLAGFESRHGGLLSELAAAAQRPEALLLPSFADRVGTGLAYAVPSPHWITLPSTANGVGLFGVAAAQAGDGRRARDAVAILLRIREGLAGEPTMVSITMALPVERDALAVLWEGMAAGALDAGALAWIQAELGTIDARAEYVRGMQGELIVFMERVDAMEEDPQLFAETVGLRETLSPYFPKAWFDLTRVTYVDWMFGYLIEPAMEGGLTAVPRRAAELEARMEETRGRPFGAVTHSHVALAEKFSPIDYISHVAGEMIALSSQRKMGLVACAVERFRLESGALPETLDALVPAYLDAIPLGPWSGAPVGYRIGDDGRYTLWTAGPEGEDAEDAEDAEVWRSALPAGG